MHTFFCKLTRTLTIPDPQLRLRLLVVHQSSSATLFTVAKGGSNAWSATPDPAAKVESVAHPLPQGSFVFDLKSGKAITASRSLFARTLNGTGGVQPASCAWLSVGQKGAKCVAGLTGDRIGKVDWSLKAGGSVVQAQIIERLGELMPLEGKLVLHDHRQDHTPWYFLPITTKFWHIPFPTWNCCTNSSLRFQRIGSFLLGELDVEYPLIVSVMYPSIHLET